MALKSKKPEAVRLSVPVAEVTKEDLVRVNLNVPAAMRARWKIAAVEREISLGELVIQCVEAHLNK